MPSPPSPWLRQYGNLSEYQWRLNKPPDNKTTPFFTRPLGLTESSFDSDGRYHEGRADQNIILTINIQNHLSEEDFRERILLAWTRLRCLHTLLQARTIHDEGSEFAPNGRFFAVDVHGSVGRAIEDAGRHLVFVGDHYPDGVDVEDFYRHVMNVGRLVDADVALGRAFVLPVESGEQGKGVLKVLFVLSHQILDGLASFLWMRDFVRVLNEDGLVLKERLRESIQVEDIRRRLPLPQEALYPPIPGSPARQRWFWAITRILRHVRRPLPTGFANPLRRDCPRKEAIPLSPTYARILDYTRPPLLNTYHLLLHISARNTQRLRALCKSVSATLGAGIYALAALVAMELHQHRFPHLPREAFITGFPLNPRAFFNHHTDPDSMMLAFSDGIALPFLPADLPLAGRLRLLARQAQRQLASYQKRPNAQGRERTRQDLTSRGAGLILANQYLLSLERANEYLPAPLRKTLNHQGHYPVRQNPNPPTHSLSSVGNREALISAGIGGDLEDPGREFVADFGDMTANMRPREGGFLVGIGGTKDGLFGTPSMDANVLDPVWIGRWKERFETALDELGDNQVKL